MDDDTAWQASASAEAMFGSFPPSQRRYDEAHANRNAASAAQRTQIENARVSVISLAADTAAMLAVTAQGVAAVAAAGAERIALSDERYFGAAGRGFSTAMTIDTSRLRLLSKPHVHLPTGEKLKPDFEAALDRYRALGMPMSVNFDGRVMTQLLDTK